MREGQTAEKIAAAASLILDEEGHGAVTIRRVAGAVGITPMAVYRHYPDRQGLLNALADGGTGGIVMDEGVLFRTNENAFVQTKRKLLDDCDLSCIVSLPAGVFMNAGANSKTNLLFSHWHKNK